MPLEAADITQITELLNTSINGALARILKTDIPALITASAPKVEAVIPVVKKEDKPEDQEKVTLRTRLDLLEKENREGKQATAKANLQSAVQTKLAGFTFVNDAARTLAMNTIMAELSYDAAGAIRSADLTPLDDYLPKRMEALDFTLMSKNVSGSGAGSGSSAAGGASNLNLEDIKPGMSEADFAKTISQLASISKS